MDFFTSQWKGIWWGITLLEGDESEIDNIKTEKEIYDKLNHNTDSWRKWL